MVTWRAAAVGVLGALALAAGLGCGHAETPTGPPTVPRLPAIVVVRAEPLPPLARELLAPRMHRNADVLAALHAAVLSIDHPAAGEAARAILAEPRLARPAPEAGPTLNDEIPPGFFDLQDRLVQATRALEAAASARDDAALSTAYGELTTACVACHATYLRSPPAPAVGE